jgi:rhodanese-related sulfurtransferase
MPRFAVVAIVAALAAVTANAQKVQIPAQSSNPNLIITPAQKPDPSLEEARRISRDDANRLVSEKKAVFVDVRSKESYDAGHIKGAINIPESQLLARMGELPPKMLLVTYCACVKEHTAARAVVDLNAHGVKNTAALIGGWNEWAALGLPTESSFSKKK